VVDAIREVTAEPHYDSHAISRRVAQTAAPDELVATRAPSSHAQLQERVAARVLAAVETEALPSMHASPPALSPRARLRTPSEPAIPEELHDERG